MKQRQTLDALSARDRAAVEEVSLMTSEIRQHSGHIESLAKKRRRKIVGLRKRGVTLRLLSESMGVSMQAVQKVLAEEKSEPQGE